MLKPIKREKLHSDCSDSDERSGPSPAKAILPKPRVLNKQRISVPRPIQQNTVVDQSIGAETVKLINMAYRPQHSQDENLNKLTQSQRVESFMAKYLYLDS